VIEHVAFGGASWWCQQERAFFVRHLPSGEVEGQYGKRNMFPKQQLTLKFVHVAKTAKYKKVPVSKNKHGMCPCSGSKIAEFNFFYHF